MASSRLERPGPHGAETARNLFSGITAPYNTLGLTGKAYDPKAGLVDFSARWYDPAVGRFTQPDPFRGFVSEPTSLHRYAYASNNPVNRVDRWGYSAAYEGGGGAGTLPGDDDNNTDPGENTDPGNNTDPGDNTNSGDVTNPGDTTNPGDGTTPGGTTDPGQSTDSGNNTDPGNSDPGGGGGDDDGGSHHHEPTAGEVASGKYSYASNVSGQRPTDWARFGRTADKVAAYAGTASLILNVAGAVSLFVPGLQPLAPLLFGAARITGLVSQAAGLAGAAEMAYEATQGRVRWGQVAGRAAMEGFGLAAPWLGKQTARLTKSALFGVARTEVVQRAMSIAELESTETTGLMRGGRPGTIYVSDAVNADALRARQRLALPQTPQVRVTMEVPKGVFSSPSVVEPKYGMPGGGVERLANGLVPAKIVGIRYLR